MGRTAGQFCSRDSMYRFQDEVQMAPPIVDAEEVRNAAMTWQQRQEFGSAVKANERKAKGVHWKPLDLTTVQDPPVTDTVGSGESWSEQRAKHEVAIVNPRHQPREKTAPKTPVSSPPVSIDSSTSDIPDNAGTVQKKSRKRQNHKKKNADNKKMAPLPEKAYVQPHLRGKQQVTKSAYVMPHHRKSDAAPTATPTNGEATTSFAPGASTVESTNTKLGNTGNLDSSPYRTSHASTRTNSLPTTPMDPKSSKAEAPQGHTPRTPEKSITPKTQTVNGESHPGWDTPKPSPPPAAPKAGNPRWPRTRGPAKKTVWPKQRDMKPLPSESDSDGGVSFKSDSNGDPNYDVKKLIDWNGDWLPPPEQWSARKGHTSRHFGQGIEQWINGHGEECLGDLEVKGSLTFTDDSCTEVVPGSCKEVVPKYWIVSQIEQKSLGEFWKLMPTRQPSALSDVSVQPPFWERYTEDPEGYFIDSLVVPDAEVDPNDPDNNFGGADLLASATSRIAAIEERKKYTLRKSAAKQKRTFPEPKPVGPPPEDRRIVPKSNVYFRPVQPADIEGIAIIYNHYIEHTIFADEFDALAENQIRNRVDTIVTKGLPYLVAVARGNQPQGPTGFVKERIVGFASLKDYRNQSSMYRYTFELDLYVHPGFVSQNTASCLLDRLLEMCNTGYNACGGYEYHNEYEYLKTGPSRVIKTIILTVHKEHGEKDEETLKFLRRFKFNRAGHISRIGYKLGNEVDAFLYAHTTTETIEPGRRPTVPPEH